MRSDLLLVAAFSLAVSGAQAQQPVFDLHVHLHHREASLREYEAQATADGIEVTGLGVMWFGGGSQALQGDTGNTRLNNDWVIDLAAKNAKLLPIGTVHPYDGDAALDELRRIAGRGIKVLKLHPHTQKFDSADPRVLTLVNLAGQLGVIVLMDNANILPGDSEKLFNLALQAPKTKFIFAHMGGLNFRFWNILAAARTAENLFANNIYFDISFMVALVGGSPVENEFVWTIRNVGVDHVLLGSDFPQASVAQNLHALNKLALNDSEKAAIRYGNAQKLFGLKPR